MNLREIPNGLTPELYDLLREKVHFQKYPAIDVAAALKNTLFSVAIYDEKRPVGISRIVGDGRIVFFIKDVVVDPEYQHRGIGKMLVKSLLRYIDEKACPNAYVGLMCTPNTEPFYEEFGFVRRPSNGLGSGMVNFIHTKG